MQPIQIVNDTNTTIAVTEKLSALLTEEYLVERAKRGRREGYLAALAQVPDVEPDENDRLPTSVYTQINLKREIL